VTDLPGPNDAAIRAMLVDRAERAGPFRIDLATVIASAGPRASRGLLGGGRMARLSVGATALAAVIVAAVLVAGPLAVSPAGSPGSTPPPGSNAPVASSNGLSPSALSEARLLTAAEFGDLVRTRSTSLAPIIVAVSGTLEADPTVRCRASKCSTVLAGSGSVHVTPVGDIGPGPWDGSGPKTGTFALRTRALEPVDAHVAEYLGTLTVPPTGGPAWFVQDLREGAVTAEGAYAAVLGWLVRDPLHPCPAHLNPPVVAYGCPSDDWLSESEFQPIQPDGSALGPPAALYLSSGSYDRWAPDPAPFGRDNVGVVPRFGTYLIWLVSDGCGPNTDCAPPPPRWRIVGRFDPIVTPVEPSPIASSNPALLADGAVPPPSGDAWTVALVRDRPIGDATFVIRAWLVATPPLQCLASPAPSGEPDYGCAEIDWLTDDAFQPWVANGSSGGTRDPGAGIRVQNGAYASFAPLPAVLPDTGALTPRFGDWIVRETAHAECIAGHACPISTIHWEVIARLP